MPGLPRLPHANAARHRAAALRPRLSLRCVSAANDLRSQHREDATAAPENDDNDDNQPGDATEQPVLKRLAGERPFLSAVAPACLPAHIVYHTRGIRRFVRAVYAAYSFPNCCDIILSSAPIRSAKRTANATKFERPATQFGITRAWPTE